MCSFGVSSASTHYFPAAAALHFPAFAEIYANDVEGNEEHRVQAAQLCLHCARLLLLLYTSYSGILEILRRRCDTWTSA